MVNISQIDHINLLPNFTLFKLIFSNINLYQTFSLNVKYGMKFLFLNRNVKLGIKFRYIMGFVLGDIK